MEIKGQSKKIMTMVESYLDTNFIRGGEKGCCHDFD